MSKHTSKVLKPVEFYYVFINTDDTDFEKHDLYSITILLITKVIYKLSLQQYHIQDKGKKYI